MVQTIMQNQKSVLLTFEVINGLSCQMTEAAAPQGCYVKNTEGRWKQSTNAQRYKRIVSYHALAANKAGVTVFRVN